MKTEEKENDTMTLDEICTQLGIDLKNRTKVLGRIKDKYSHGIQDIVEHGRKGKLKKSELVMVKNVADEFIRMTAQKQEKNKRSICPHGVLYLLKLTAITRNADGTFNVWIKVGETVELIQRLKQYRGVLSVQDILCVLPVHDRRKSEDNALEFLLSKNLTRGKREYFSVPEARLDEIVESFFMNHIIFTGNYVLQHGGT